MKPTLTQLTNVTRGMRRVRDAANRGIQDWYYTCTIEGTFYSLRGKRTNRGNQIN